MLYLERKKGRRKYPLWIFIRGKFRSGEDLYRGMLLNIVVSLLSFFSSFFLFVTFIHLILFPIFIQNFIRFHFDSIVKRNEIKS